VLHSTPQSDGLLLPIAVTSPPKVALFAVWSAIVGVATNVGFSSENACGDE
jgi:hypothetical protein